MSEPRILMQFYDTSFFDFDEDIAGYGAAMLSLTHVSKPSDISAGQRFFTKYAAMEGHKHQKLCAKCLAFLRAEEAMGY